MKTVGEPSTVSSPSARYPRLFLYIAAVFAFHTPITLFTAKAFLHLIAHPKRQGKKPFGDKTEFPE